MVSYMAAYCREVVGSIMAAMVVAMGVVEMAIMEALVDTLKGPTVGGALEAPLT